jgi:membrane-bound ClpP family serine protease
MSGLLQTYIVLVTAGLALLFLEIFVPGGVLGIIGGLALLTAIVCGFIEFPHPYGLVSALGILAVSGVSLALWVRLVPGSLLGRKIALAEDGRAFKSSDRMDSLVGAEGVAQSALRPAGIARFNGQRVDVVAEGQYIDAGARIRVVAVEGNRVTVREIQAA